MFSRLRLSEVGDWLMVIFMVIVGGTAIVGGSYLVWTDGIAPYFRHKKWRQEAEIRQRAASLSAMPIESLSPADLEVLVNVAKMEAVRKHPALGVEGSTFHKYFENRQREYREKRPKYFESNDWPIRLADEIHNALFTGKL